MPMPTYGQVTVDKDTWDRLNARIAELEAAMRAVYDYLDKATASIDYEVQADTAHEMLAVALGVEDW